MRGATPYWMRLKPYVLFQSTLLMRGATSDVITSALNIWISIHAPHARSDYGNAGKGKELSISIHAPHARSDPVNRWKNHHVRIFQSTLLMRGATKMITILPLPILFQSTLLMRGATAEMRRCGYSGIFQSTLLMRGATFNGFNACFLERFQSTLLMRGATSVVPGKDAVVVISIHAPHARSD